MAKEVTNELTYVPKKQSAALIFKKNWMLLALTVPMIVYLAIFRYGPMFGIILAFKSYDYQGGMLGSDWVGLYNFEFFFKSDSFTIVVRNAILYNVVGITLSLIASVGLALLLFELSGKIAIRFYQTFMFIPHLLSWVVVAYMVYAFLSPTHGMLIKVYELIGLTYSDWYSEPMKWIFILPIAHVWKGCGMNALIYYSSLLGIDAEYFEAASLEGATRPQIARYITLPFLYPTITILTIMSIGKIFNSDFGLFYQLPKGSPLIRNTTDVIETYTYRAFYEDSNIGQSSAVGLVQSVVGLILVTLTNWIVKLVDPERALY